jgi:Flp pilus assembly protein TadG
MTRTAGGAGRRRERGSFSLELAVLAPTLLLVISFIISVGRVTQERAMVQGAVRDAARAATINHDGTARQAAERAYAAATAGQNCDGLDLRPPVPTPGGRVTATATCRVTTLWGQQKITAQAQSVVDIYRGTT